jgi:hypothetical protein
LYNQNKSWKKGIKCRFSNPSYWIFFLNGTDKMWWIRFDLNLCTYLQPFW